MMARALAGRHRDRRQREPVDVAVGVGQRQVEREVRPTAQHRLHTLGDVQRERPDLAGRLAARLDKVRADRNAARIAEPGQVVGPRPVGQEHVAVSVEHQRVHRHRVKHLGVEPLAFEPVRLGPGAVGDVLVHHLNAAAALPRARRTDGGDDQLVAVGPQQPELQACGREHGPGHSVRPPGDVLAVVRVDELQHAVPDQLVGQLDAEHPRRGGVGIAVLVGYEHRHRDRRGVEQLAVARPRRLDLGQRVTVTLSLSRGTGEQLGVVHRQRNPLTDVDGQRQVVLVVGGAVAGTGEQQRARRTSVCPQWHGDQ